MDDIRRGAMVFQRDTYKHKKALFKKLALGQTPQALFITCADSRVEPALITHSQPGQLFVDRNPGNFVPPFHGDNASESAGIEYALSVLNIPAVIVCGHTDCGAMKGVLHPAKTKAMPAVRGWLKNGAAARRDVMKLDLPEDRQLEVLTQRNVVRQLANLKTYPAVAERVKAGKLVLVGWIYDIAHGKILELDSATATFRPLAV
jgi:carbonic anhydrase